MDDKRKKDLCFNYDGKYQFGHQCKGAKVFLLEGSPLEIDQLSKVEVKEEQKQKLNLRRLTPTQMDDKRKKDLCFNYDKMYQFGHQCKGG